MGKTNEDYIREILNDLKRIDYIRPEEIPNIDLYMDQVTTFMDEHLKFSKRYSEDKLLTKTMINNYTKNNLLPSPTKKKYSKDHMLLLVFIYYFKSFLSISDIQSILKPLTEKYFNTENELSLEEVYQQIFKLETEQIDGTAKDVVRKFMNSQKIFEAVEDEEEQNDLNNFAFICMLSFDVYVKKQIIERLIDHITEAKQNDQAAQKTEEVAKKKESKHSKKEEKSKE